MTLLFPQKLHALLEEGKYAKILSWLPHGRAFKIHNREQLVKVVLPTFSKSGGRTSFATFQRQLHYYGFQRYDKGIYFHPYFLSGCFDLCKARVVRNQSAHDGKRHIEKVGDIPAPSLRKAIENIENVPRDNKCSMNPSTPNIYPIPPNQQGFYSNQLTSNPVWGGNIQGPMSSLVLGAEYRGGYFQPYQPQRECNIAHGRYNYPQREAFHSCPPSWTSQGTIHQPFQRISYGQIPQGLKFKEQSQACSGGSVNTYDENRVLKYKRDEQNHKRVEPFHAIENCLERNQQHEYECSYSKDTTQESDSNINPNSFNDPHDGYVSCNSVDGPVIGKENTSLQGPIINGESMTASSLEWEEPVFDNKQIIYDQENSSLKANSFEELMNLSFSFP